MDLWEKAIEIAKKYEKLPLRDKIGVIAQTFGYTSGVIGTTPCHGKCSGTSDIYIRFDCGVSLDIGNRLTPKAKTVRAQSECLDASLLFYNPEIVALTKETALAALREQETVDNMIAAQKGLKPYTLLNVELFSPDSLKNAGYIGSYFVTLAVDGKIRAHFESGLKCGIARGKVGEMPGHERYFVAAGLKEDEVDFVFDNIGYSSASTRYSIPMTDDVLRRAEKTLAERSQAQRLLETRKPSIKEQLAAKPVPSDQPTKPREKEAR